MYDDDSMDESVAQQPEKKQEETVLADGEVDAKTFDGSNWNDAKKADCYFKGFNNVVPDGLLHLSDGSTVNCETGGKANSADF